MSKISNILIELTDKIQDLQEAKIKSKNVTDKIHSFFYKESLLTGESILEIELTTKALTEEELLQFSNGIHAFRLTIRKNDIEQTTGWRMFVCSMSSLYYRGSLPVVKVLGKSLIALLQEKVHWRAHKSTSIKNIVTSIAANYGLQMQSVDFNPITNTLYQCGETDWDFLQRIKNEVITISGQKQAYLYSKNKTLYFSSIDYSKPSIKKYNLGAGDDRIEDINFCYNGREISKNNGSKFILGSFDLLKKQFKANIPDPRACTILAPKLGVPYGSGINYETTPVQDFSLIQGKSFIEWNMATQKYFSFQVTALEEVELNLGDIIEIQGIDTENKTSSMNGKYPIFELAYCIMPEQAKKTKNKTFFTYIGGFRRSFHYGDIVAEGTDLSKISGQDQYIELNNQEKQPSVILVAKQL